MDISIPRSGPPPSWWCGNLYLYLFYIYFLKLLASYLAPYVNAHITLIWLAYICINSQKAGYDLEEKCSPLLPLLISVWPEVLCSLWSCPGSRSCWSVGGSPPDPQVQTPAGWSCGSRPTFLQLGQRTLQFIILCSTLIGRGISRLGSHWSRASECCWRQQSYALKNQQRGGLGCDEMDLYGIRLLA